MIEEADEDVEDSKRTITLSADIEAYETDSFAKNDYVLYATYEESSKTYVGDMKLAESVEGEVASVKGSKATINGTTYSVADGVEVNAADEGTFYLGVDGKIVDKNAKSTSTGKYVYIYNTVKKDNTVNDEGLAVAATYTAYYVDQDGVKGSSVLKVTDNKVMGKNISDLTFDGNKASDDLNGVYEYKIADGKMSKISNDHIKAGQTTKLDSSIVGSYYANAETKFVFIDVDTADNTVTATVKTGIKNVSKYTDNQTATVIEKDNIAKYVFVGVAPSAKTDESVAYLLNATPTVTKKGDDTFYAYDVMIDGEKTTLTSKNDEIDFVVDGEYTINVGDAFTYKTEDSYLTSVDEKTVIEGTVVKVVDDVVIVRVGEENKAYTMADDCVIYKVTEKDDTATFTKTNLVEDASIYMIDNGEAADSDKYAITTIVVDKRA